MIFGGLALSEAVLASNGVEQERIRRGNFILSMVLVKKKWVKARSQVTELYARVPGENPSALSERLRL